MLVRVRWGKERRSLVFLDIPVSGRWKEKERQERDEIYRDKR